MTLLLRLLAAPGEDGHLVGHAEVVDTGELVPLRDLDDLVHLVERLST